MTIAWVVISLALVLFLWRQILAVAAIGVAIACVFFAVAVLLLAWFGMRVREVVFDPFRAFDRLVKWVVTSTWEFGRRSA